MVPPVAIAAEIDVLPVPHIVAPVVVGASGTVFTVMVASFLALATQPVATILASAK